jgi:predicted dehydrogenase
MDKPIRFALVAYGKVAHLHARALESIPGVQLVAVCGRDPAKREAFAAAYGIQPYGDITEMVSVTAADVVIVASPHPQHKEHAIEALQAGAHVLVEKPMAILVEDCDEMMAAAAAAGRLLSVICQRRWYPSVQRIRQAIDAGKLGAPALGQVIMLGWRDQAYYDSDPWRGSWEHEGGGVLVNQAPHQLDLLLWLMGPAVEVSAYWENLNHPYIDVEDTAVASVRFTSGALGSILVSNSQKPGIYAKVHIHGRNGASAGVQTDGGAMFIAGMSGVLEPPYNDIWTIPGEENFIASWKEDDTSFFGGIEATEYFHALQFADFAEAVRTGRPPVVSAEDGRATVALIQAIYRSGREQCPVRL